MADWANLEEGLLDLIISKLFDQDRYNFRLVCRTWNAAAATSPYPNAPCLIHYNREEPLIHYNQEIYSWGFYQYNTFSYRSFPEFDDNAKLLCSKFGWLLMARQDKTLFFLDPFNDLTEPKIELYSKINTDDYASIHFFHPPTSPKCFIIGISSHLDRVTIKLLRYGKRKWETKKYDSDSEFLVSKSAPVLHQGVLFFVGMNGDLATLDIKSSTWIVYPKCLDLYELRSHIRLHFLFKINGDHQNALYAVFLIHESETVYVFMLCEPEMKWEMVSDLGDKMLYLSHTSSFSDVAKMKSMENTICFPMFDDDYNFLYYSLKTERYHSFDGNCSYKDSVCLTSLNYGAAWIKPIPTQQLSSTPIPTQQLSVNLEWYSNGRDLKVAKVCYFVRRFIRSLAFILLGMFTSNDDVVKLLIFLGTLYTWYKDN